MTIQAKAPVNQLALHQKAESLNRVFNEKKPISLSDLHKQHLSIKVCQAAQSVLSLLTFGIALSINPTATIIGGIVGVGTMSGSSDAYHHFKNSPKFEVKNSHIVQTNEEYIKELKHWHSTKLGVVFLNAISAGSLTATHLYPNVIGGDGFSNCFSFYSGIMGATEIYSFARKFI